MTSWLLGTLLATSALVLLVLLAREPVRRRFGSGVTYGLWLIPAARLLMPTLTRTVDRTGSPGPAVHSLMQPVIGERLLLTNVTAAQASPFDRAGGWPAVILFLWLAVALGLFVSRLIAFHRDRRAILGASEEVGRIGSIRIIRSPEVRSPVAFGIVDRVIALPVDFDRSYCERERRLALDHEIAHHRSGDLIANLFAFVLLCLQWFNPLAWVAHAAFRFDQEAACDARVLDKAVAQDRIDYGRAIARAASGRALLFASALDRRNSLHRRLQSMLSNPNPRRRFAGRLIVGIAIAVALPLTASRAVQYVDVPAAPPVRATARAAPSATIVPAAAAQTARAAPASASRTAPVPAERASDVDDVTVISGDLVTINGKTKRWEELTPAEKNQLRGALSKARAALANVHFDGQKVMRDVARATEQLRNGEVQRGLARAQAGVAQAGRDLDVSAAELRRSGQDPSRIGDAVRQSLRAVEQIDWQATNKALAAIDERKLADSVAGADQAMRAAEAELDRVELRMRDDPH